MEKDELIAAEDIAKSIGKIYAADYAFSLNPIPLDAHYTYGYLKCLTSRSTPIQETLFPYRALYGMSYFEGVDVFGSSGNEQAYFPKDLHLSNREHVVDRIRSGITKEVREFLNLMRPAHIEEHEEIEAKIIKGLCLMAK
jgi:hypothetical protein